MSVLKTQYLEDFLMRKLVFCIILLLGIIGYASAGGGSQGGSGTQGRKGIEELRATVTEWKAAGETDTNIEQRLRVYVAAGDISYEDYQQMLSELPLGQPAPAAAPINESLPSQEKAAPQVSSPAGIDLDAAIREAAGQMGESLPAGTEVALVSVASTSAQFSEYVISRLEAALVSGRKLIVVDRANLDKIREEQGFQLSGEVDDNSAKEIGKILGAGAIVTGSFINLGDVYGLSLKAINMKTAAIAVSYPADIAKSVRIETLLASGGGSAGTPRTAQAPRTSGGAAPVVPAPVPAAQASASAPASATVPVEAAPSGGDSATLTTIEQISAYLATVTGRASSPAPLKVAIPLGAMTNSGSGWHKFLTTLNDARKFVALDLSACTMDGRVFDPRVGINAEEMNAGASFIVEIILPNAATSTAVSRDSDNITFRYFTNLRKAEGNVTDIGAYAFARLTRLTTVSFPKVINIGQYAFYQCGGLTAVSFPGAMSIGEDAFRGCGGLTTVSFPEAMSIGQRAFYQCGGLTTASFPEADSICYDAFWSCDRLTSVTLGTITPPNFNTSVMSGNLRDAYYQQPEGQRAGRYTRSENNNSWSKR